MTEWTLTTDGLGEYTVAGILNVPTIQIGETATFGLYDPVIAEDSDALTVTSDTEITDPITASSIDIQGGSTLNIKNDAVNTSLNGQINVVSDAQSAHERLRSLVRYAGRYSLVEGYTGSVNYLTQLPSSAPIDDLLVKLTPNSTALSEDIEGVYALVAGGQDTRNVTLKDYQIELELVIVDTGAAYSTLSDAQTATQITL